MENAEYPELAPQIILKCLHVIYIIGNFLIIRDLECMEMHTRIKIIIREGNSKNQFKILNTILKYKSNNLKQYVL